jgi:DNA-binding transcriptional ArsR family regulator
MAKEFDLEELRRIGQGERGIEDAVSYAVGHRIRLEIVAALHEGSESAAGLAKIVRRPLSTVTHHIEQLLKDGLIGIAKTEKVGNLTQAYYRVIKLTEFSREEVAAMTAEERHALFALVVQSATTEALCALWAEKMIDDPNIVLAWNRINLSKQGRKAIADEQIRSWERLKEIECEDANRRAETGDQGVTYIVSTFGFERSRTVAPEPKGNSLASGDD